MKIIFVENRYKTALWEVIGQELQAQGHKIFWIVQNPFFKPSFGDVRVLPFPKKRVSNAGNSQLPNALEKIRTSNRALNHFQLKDNGFIQYYHELIEDLIGEINPNVVFGEATAFHELLVSHSCKSRSIHYLHPCTCRYPVGRFSFYKYDTLEPFGGSLESYSDETLQGIIDSISGRKVKPDYMVKRKSPVSRGELIADKVRLVRSFYKGEIYNTPSPFVKRRLTRKNQDFIREWDELATPLEDVPDKTGILYPLQMQPEANIDVWGYPYRNQNSVIQEILDSLDDQEILIIKPNPKSKYEIDQELLDLIKSYPDKLFGMAHSVSMDDVLQKINLVVTVTGTISIECIFSNIPVVMFGIGIQTKQKNCLQVTNSKEIRTAIQLVRDGTFPKNTEEENRLFLSELVQSSFEGIMGDGLHGREHLENKENLAHVKDAFRKVILQLGEC